MKNLLSNFSKEKKNNSLRKLDDKYFPFSAKNDKE